MAIILFAYAAFFAGGIRAQNRVCVDPIETTAHNEPSIVVRPWDADGNFLVASWQYSSGSAGGKMTYTSKSTDGGLDWTEQGNIPVPNTSIYDHDGDAKIAYRYDGTGSGSNPELLAVYRAWNDPGTFPQYEATHVAFSTNDGNLWAHDILIESHAWCSTCEHDYTIRPSIAVDNNPSNISTVNNAYVTWTSEKDAPTNSTYAMVATIARYTYTKTTATINTDMPGTAANPVDACDIQVASNGTVYVLWRVTHTITSKRDLYLSYSTDGGATWPTTNRVTVESGSPSDGLAAKFEYQDYPVLTFSKYGTTESAFVGYTQGTTNSANPSDIFLTSASVSSLSTWTTPYNINADAIFGPIQFQPAICPDGAGNVYLLYYSQNLYSPYLEEPILYRGGTTNSSVLIHKPISAGIKGFSKLQADVGKGVGDYIAIAYNAMQQREHPVWTDLNSSGIDEVYTLGCSAPQGNTSSPTIGDLGFSNQRKIVMTGNTTHLVALGGTTSLASRISIMYSEQVATGGGTTTNWTTPLQLDNTDIAHNPTPPSIGVYQYSSSGQKAVAAVWSQHLRITSSPTFGGTYLFIRVKEYNNCEAGDLSDWSSVDYVKVSDYNYLINPVVAPLTAPVSGSATERFLIGWVITYELPSSFYSNVYSVTYLRGLQTGSEWEASSPLSPGVETKNENWSIARGGGKNPGTGTYFAGSWTSPHGLSLAYVGSVTATSNESNGFGLPDGPSSDLNSTTESQQVVWSGDGSVSGIGTEAFTPIYQIIPSTITPKLGEPINTSMWWYLWHQISDVYIPPLYDYVKYDRNPSVTINSAGQNLASWEHMEGYAYVFPWMGGFFDKSAIYLAMTNGSGGWSLIKDYITENALDASFTWLRNPSITAFPKTTVGATNNDLDPATAELLYWQQKKVVPAGALWTWHWVNDLHERRFWRLSGHSWWSGQWNPLDNPDPKGWWPSGYSGANSQRSFGIYNSGPHWSAGNLFGPASSQYPDYGFGSLQGGLSCALGNTVSSNIPQLTLTNPDPDVGALSMGTFVTALGVQFYRSETRVKDSSEVTFKWGKVYVEDTALDLPIREVMLHNGIPDSDVFVSHDAMRDSIFATEWFNWPVSAVIKYDRMMTMPITGTFDTVIDSNINYYTRIDTTIIDSTVTYDTIPADTVPYYFEVFDTTMVYDTTYDSTTHSNTVDTSAIITDAGPDSTMIAYASYVDSTVALDNMFPDSGMVYDTVRGTFHWDSTFRADSSFFAPGTQMKYTVQLVHQSGHIDTVETAIYNPSANRWITPMAVQIDNAGYVDDTVMLRVIGDLVGVPDADSDVGFAREAFLDTSYMIAFADTSIAIGTGGGIVPPPDTCFAVDGPYPNPSSPSANDVSILVHYCRSSSLITAQVYNSLGSPVGAASFYTSDGQMWDRLPINAPGTAGAYHITVTVGSYSSNVGYSIY
ncbi:MAG: hypothetical protein ACHQNE_00825 [Candidatus Kapaibacterium sp.]